MFRPIYAYLQRAEHEAAERLRQGRKRCSKCHEERPLTEFNRESRARDGHRADCQHEAARQAYSIKRDRTASAEGIVRS